MAKGIFICAVVREGDEVTRDGVVGGDKADAGLEAEEDWREP